MDGWTDGRRRPRVPRGDGSARINYGDRRAPAPEKTAERVNLKHKVLKVEEVLEKLQVWNDERRTPIGSEFLG